MRNKRGDQIDLFGLSSAGGSQAETPRAGSSRSRASGSDSAVVAPAAVDDELVELAAKLAPNLRLGTSSWSYPGWRGLVFQESETTSRLSKLGLAAYAKHPLLRSVGLDRTYHAPVSASVFAYHATLVPQDFRFLVKAHAAVTTSDESRTRGQAHVPARFLDAQYAAEEVIAPAVEGLGERLGVVLFQFSPLNWPAGRLASFPELLARFLDALPRGVPYSVEIRDSKLLVTEYAKALSSGGASHCYNVHPRMPSVHEQHARIGEAVSDTGTVAVRWMLRPDQQFESAREAYSPYDTLAAPDLERRGEVADLLATLVGSRRSVLMIVNNKAEGSAPLTLIELARLLADRHSLAMSEFMRG